jgi:hypothetical protein
MVHPVYDDPIVADRIEGDDTAAPGVADVIDQRASRPSC